MGSRETGILGENAACQYLACRGYTIVHRNYREVFGEIDIIAEKEGVVHFIEVKSAIRREDDFSRVTDRYRPEELAHAEKIRKVARLGQHYMQKKNDKRAYQIDVIGVDLILEKQRAHCRFFQQVL